VAVEFEGIGRELLSKLLTGSVIVIAVIIFSCIILGIALYIRYLRKFNIKVEIQSLRGSGTMGEPVYKLVTDLGGFIDDKKNKTRYFRLMKEKIDLPSPPLECLQFDAKGRNHLKIYQKSDTEYFYLMPDRIDKDYIVRNGVKVPVATLNQKIVEGDIGYWNQLKKRDNRKLFDTEGLLIKLLPFIIPTLMFMLVIFMTYLITEHWGEFSAAANALKDAAEALRSVSTAEVVTG